MAGLRQLFLQDPDHDTDVFNAQGAAPLHLAAAGGHIGAVSFLLQKGSFVDMQDWDVSGAAPRQLQIVLHAEHREVAAVAGKPRRQGGQGMGATPWLHPYTCAAPACPAGQQRAAPCGTGRACGCRDAAAQVRIHHV